MYVYIALCLASVCVHMVTITLNNQFTAGDMCKLTKNANDLNMYIDIDLLVYLFDKALKKFKS